MTDSIKLFKLHLVAEVGSSIDYTGKKFNSFIAKQIIKNKIIF